MADGIVLLALPQQRREGGRGCRLGDGVRRAKSVAETILGAGHVPANYYEHVIQLYHEHVVQLYHEHVVQLYHEHVIQLYHEHVVQVD